MAQRSSNNDDSNEIHGYFRNACNGIIRRFKKGDYAFLAKLGAGCLLGFGCYKLYQRYDPHFCITDHVTLRDSIWDVPLTIFLREISCSTNASESSEDRISHQSTGDSEGTIDESMERNEPGTGNPRLLNASVEIDSRNPPQEANTNTGVQDFNQPTNDLPGPSLVSQLPAQPPQHENQQPPFQQPTNQQQPSPRSQIIIGDTINNVKHFIDKRQNCETNIKAPAGADVTIGNRIDYVENYENDHKNNKINVT